MAAGGAVGSALGRYSYFGLYEGGIFQLASGFGWFHTHGAKDPHARVLEGIDVARALTGLPIANLVRQVRPEPTAYDEFVRTPLTDPFWQSLDYVSEPIA